MTFLEALQAHRGGLVLLKDELWWYGGRGWDGARDRVCLLMDTTTDVAVVSGTVVPAASTLRGDTVILLLLTAGAPHWVWVCANDLELLQPECNPSDGVV
jgi:hypothetical protein